MSESLLENISKHVVLNQDEIDFLMSSLEIIALKRRQRILQQGEPCRHIYFVEQGSLRAFHINPDGNESTIMFALSDWWITDMECFVRHKAAKVSIEALESSRIISISSEKLEALYAAIPKFEKAFRILFQNAYIREQQRTLQYLSYSTKERYLHFIDKYPAFVEKVTQKQIASYLGVTPEFLSSIKKNIDS